MESQKYKAIIIGASGAIGRELILTLLSSKKYSKITIPVRRTIEEWEKLEENDKQILNIIKVENLDFLLLKSKEEIEKIIGNEKYDVLFNVLGSRVGRGEEEFKKVDFTYVISSAELCEKLNINHFSHCSAIGANKDSWFMYNRVKGEAEEEEKKKNINYISIFKPGQLLNRRNDDRFIETIGKYIPFLPKIECKDLAFGMYIDDFNYQKNEKGNKKISIFENSDILKIVENGKKKVLFTPEKK